ncbi:TIR domain-containing protein, partial [bacterium]|nr:TIR domain-containing protein [bacterium]
PLTHEDRTYGVMQVLNKANGQEPYTDGDVELVSRFAVQATIAIRNAILFDQMLASSGLYGLPEVRDDLIPHLTSPDMPAVCEKVSVLFADMRAFDRLRQVTSSLEELRGMLSDFLAMLSSKVLEHKGIVNKFLGDGAMAFFRGPDGARNAVDAAFAMVDSFGELRSAWDETSNVDLSFLDIGVGIATDDVILGNVGNEQLSDFTIVGTAVNLANALEEAARDGRRVLCDNATYRAAKDVVGQAEGPLTAETHGGSATGLQSFKMYHLQGLKSHESGTFVFISYANKDTDRVRDSVVAPLRQRHIRTFFSGDTIRPAEKWEKTIGEGIDECDWFIVVISNSSVHSDWVEAEVMHALSREPLKGRIIPVRIDDVSPAELTWRLSQIQHIDMLDGQPGPIEEILALIEGAAEAQG